MENAKAMKRAALLVLVLVAAGCGTKTTTVTQTQTVTKTVTKTVSASSCKGTDLTATFDAIAGSQGAGNISYRLKLTSSSASPCQLTITGFQLLDANGADVPTNITPLGGPTALGAGETIGYEARFSPDVNGTGDHTNGQCQPTSATLRVSLGSDTVDAPITPPTPVCEQGSMTFRAD